MPVTPDYDLRILRAIYRSGHAYQRIGVLLLDLVPEGARQLTFWDLATEQRPRNALMQALDKAAAPTCSGGRSIHRTTAASGSSPRVSSK